VEVWVPEHLRTYWLKGDDMSVTCPYCAAVNSVHIAIAREYAMNLRPVECDECRREFEIEATADGIVLIEFPLPEPKDPERFYRDVEAMRQGRYTFDPRLPRERKSKCAAKKIRG
jgi:hypothetical protein